MAAKALDTIRGPRIVKSLTSCLQDKDWYVRKQAAETLERIGVFTIPFLINAFNNKDWGMREQAL
ncbi:MAG: HEAT repeat domain-containing protein, partial [bacterium]